MSSFATTVAFVLLCLLAGIALLLFVSRRKLSSTTSDLEALRQRFRSIIDVDTELARVLVERDKAIAQREAARVRARIQQQRWEEEYKVAVAELEHVRSEIELARDAQEIQSFGIHEPVFAYDDPDEYVRAIKAVVAEQKSLIRAKRAAVCSTEWTVSGSKTEGRKMTNRNLKLLLRAFNGEADTSIAKVRYNNLSRTQDRIRKAWEAINALGAPIQTEITREYLKLKLKELQLTFEHEAKKQQIKEEQRAVRAEMREEIKVQREIERATREAEAEEKRYNAALEKARAELGVVSGEKRAKLEETIAELSRRLEEAEANKQRALSMAQQTKSGHVYVISNLGSFGERITKIGMTRRLDPFERVAELGDASVPYPFDVHAMIYSENAPELENTLHRAFADRRVNLVNERREYFYVSADEVKELVAGIDPDARFVDAAEAAQYRQSEAIREAREKHDNFTADAIIAEARSQLEVLRARWARIDEDDDEGGDEEAGWKTNEGGEDEIADEGEDDSAIDLDEE